MKTRNFPARVNARRARALASLKETAANWERTLPRGADPKSVKSLTKKLALEHAAATTERRLNPSARQVRTKKDRSKQHALTA